MPDREKVIKAIDICLGHGKCNDCSYHSGANYSDQNCRGRMLQDALALLEEQEKEIAPGIDATGIGCYLRCRACTEKLPDNAKYCPHCGKKVKWE